MSLDTALGIASIVLSLLAVYLSIYATLKANRTADAQLELQRELSSPVLSFNVRTEILGNPALEDNLVTVEINNGGQQTATVTAGRILLHSYKYPEHDEPTDLKGIQILPGVPHVWKRRFKSQLIYGDGRSVPHAKLECYAIYHGFDGKDKTASQEYNFSASHRDFI